jgi:hypothetical protein
MTLPTKLPEGLPGILTHTGGPNPTTPGPHNHLGGPPRPPLTIEGLTIEDGHGALPVEHQLADHLYRISLTADPEALRSLYGRLLALRLDHGAINDRLVTRWTLTLADNGQRLFSDDAIAKFFAQFETRDQLAKWQPGGTPN